MRLALYSGIILVSGLSSLSPVFAADPTGDWRVADGVANIRVAQCNASMWGVVSWEKTPGGRDEYNPDVSKKNRPTLGMAILLDRLAGAVPRGGRRAEVEAHPRVAEVRHPRRRRRERGRAPLDRLEVFHLVFPRARGMQAAVSHPGQEHCYVLSGEVLFHVDGVQHRLKAGDGILIDSQLPHRAENAGRGQAHVLMTVARPTEVGDAPDWWRLSSSSTQEESKP